MLEKSSVLQLFETLDKASRIKYAIKVIEMWPPGNWWQGVIKAAILRYLRKELRDA